MELKTYGVKRKIDDLGRIVVPKEFRETINIECGDVFVITPCYEGLFMAIETHGRIGKREVARRLDELGRISVPKVFRKELELNEGDVVYLHCCNNGILIELDNGEAKEDFVIKD